MLRIATDSRVSADLWSIQHKWTILDVIQIHDTLDFWDSFRPDGGE